MLTIALTFSASRPEKEVSSLLSNTSIIYINRSSSFADGVVNDNDVEMIVDEIAEAIKDLEYDGKKVIKQVYRPEEIYSSKEIKKGPDLVLLRNYGYDLKGNLNETSVYGRSHFTGMHTQDDAFFFSTRSIPEDRLTIFDIKTYVENLIS